ncbi:MAG TPA: 3-deoxy-D-manno-octulosonate 8-phosphate phosphatase [Candidatus Marinimicrobia bacterium]|jgi:3-deoxy-D-manno-octulosonate 8-phosphate phosphatase (KDO 8-P phosphatase)|nr:3-deoxy-D-manno-octulosonate 8-phosphate phosphatase [Candidatus Neomarinimicrobiota bacterium]
MNVEMKKIKLLISDVDGVLTDGTFYKGTDNMEFKRFTVLDGVGTAMARAADLKIALISGRYSPATEHRAKELKIEDVYNGRLNKLHAYKALKAKYDLDDSEIAYVGDDIIDIPVMEQVGVPIAVANATPAVKAVATYITKVSGGYGAFREAVEWIIEEKGETKAVMNLLKERIKNS